MLRQSLTAPGYEAGSHCGGCCPTSSPIAIQSGASTGEPAAPLPSRRRPRRRSPGPAATTQNLRLHSGIARGAPARRSPLSPHLRAAQSRARTPAPGAPRTQRKVALNFLRAVPRPSRLRRDAQPHSPAEARPSSGARTQP